MPGTTHTLIVIHLAGQWRVFHRRHLISALAEALPEGWAILAVNRPLTADVTPLKYPGRLRRELLRRAPIWISRQLHVFTPLMLLHERTATHVPGMTKLNLWFLRCQLRNVIRQQFHETRRIISWIYHPYQSWTLDLLPSAKTIYECYDEYGVSPNGEQKPEIRYRERRLLTECELIFVTANVLGLNRKTAMGKIVYMPNGAPTSFIRTYAAKSVGLCMKPRVGYLGNLRLEIDVELLGRLARHNPQWQFVFVGPVQKTQMTTRLRLLPNVEMLGCQPYDNLPAILECFDVGLAPFRLNAFTEAINPLKIYEYMAAGVPIVASDLPELRRFADIIRLVENTPEAFAEAITAVLGADRETLRRKLIATAREYTWEAICRRVIVPELLRLVGDSPS